MVLSELGGRLDRRNDDRDEKQVSFDDNAGCFPLTPLHRALHFLSLMHFELSPFSSFPFTSLCRPLLQSEVTSVLVSLHARLIFFSGFFELAFLFKEVIVLHQVMEASQPQNSLTVGTGSHPCHSQGTRTACLWEEAR